MRCLELESFLENLGEDGYNRENVSPPTFGIIRYNCIAWAAGENTRPWWPSKEDPYYYYWPPHLPREEYERETLENFLRAFEWIGYSRCADPAHKVGIEKVAIFVNDSQFPKHAARQLPSGAWTSKCGDYEDIEHFSLDSVAGSLYGKAVAFLERKRESVPRE